MTWSSEHERHVKRSLSRYEKTSLVNAYDRALILPGEPNTEVEELINSGFDPMYIVCVEREQDIADALYEYYWDQCHVHWEEIGKFMARSKSYGQYGYVHLDYCGHLKQDEIEGIQHWRRLMAPVSRVRVSIFRGMRMRDQFDLEEMLQEQLLVRLCEAISKDDKNNYERWALLADSFREATDDTTRVVGALMLFNFFFGIDNVWKWTDRCALEGVSVPEISGTHIIQNITRFKYNEEGAPNHMFTVWADLAPMPEMKTKKTRFDALAEMLLLLAIPIPYFKPDK